MNEAVSLDSKFPIDCLNRLFDKERENGAGILGWRTYLLPIEELSEGLPVPFLGIMALIWQLRPKDLQILYPLNTYESRMDFIGWCIVNGRSEYLALAEDEEWSCALRCKANLPASMNYADAGNVFTWEMVFVERMRKDLNFDIKTPDGRNAFFVWFITHGEKELRSADWAPAGWQKDYLNNISDYHSLTNFEKIIYCSRQDVMTAFPLPEERDNFAKWLVSASEFTFVKKIDDSTKISDKSEKKSFGVNVIGYAFGQLGIGEDARMAATALDRASVPVVMINFAPGANVGQNDRSMLEFVKPEEKYNINMYCLTAIEQGRFFAENGSRAAAGGYNIGYWPWELNEWPDEWRHLFALVDEVWVSSRHTYDTVAPVSDVPVFLMPMAVEIPQPSSKTRPDFGLPEEVCLFLFSFDINSSVHRKNPSACIEAFMQAFPASEYPNEVGLVIKVQAPRTQSSEYSLLKSLQGKDARIFLIEETLDKPDLLALYTSCDAFVSLHRAEGFGRNIAEAMLLERPIIVTGYSGNLSFNSIENSFLVKCKIIPVQPGQYENSSGMVWADPDIPHAATRMRSIYNRKDAAKMIAKNGKNSIALGHNSFSVGKHYFERLRAIKLN